MTTDRNDRVIAEMIERRDNIRRDFRELAERSMFASRRRQAVAYDRRSHDHPYLAHEPAHFDYWRWVAGGPLESPYESSEAMERWLGEASAQTQANAPKSTVEPPAALGPGGVAA